MQKHSNRSFWDFLLDWKALPLLYVLFSLVQGVIGNAVFSLLTNGFTDTETRTLRPELILLVSIIFVCMLTYLVYRTVAYLTRAAPPPTPSISGGSNEAFSIPRTGIIFTLGQQPSTLRHALTSQKPTWVGLICTTETQTVADALLSEFGYDDAHVRKWPISHKDVQAIRSGVVALSNWLTEDVRLLKHEVVIDVTGGTKPMSIGAFLASEALRVDTQYVVSQYNTATNTPIPGTQDEILLTHYAFAPSA
jgi:hypothetical protein